jgi:hypothetical protein
MRFEEAPEDRLKPGEARANCSPYRDHYRVKGGWWERAKPKIAVPIRSRFHIMKREITKAKTTYCYSPCRLKQSVENRKRCGVGSGWAAG